MRILVFGGGFDPVHRGHLALLRAADSALKPDRVLLAPSGTPPHKPPPAQSFAARAALLRAALKEPENRALARKTEISDLEARGRGAHYTVGTLRRLKRLFPGAEFWLLLGADQYAAFPTWRRPDEVRRLARLAVGARVGRKRPRGSGVFLVPGVFPEASSTALRAALACEGPERRALPRRVLREIERRGFYGARWRRWLRARLSPERYRHSLAVSKLAGELAARHGVDVWKAAAAGLLHDAGRAVPLSRLAAYALRRKLRVPRLRETIENAPILLHAHAGADLARRRLGVKDAAVLSAIEKHTLGAPGMSALDAVVYVADACSEDRGHPGAARLRALARRDLDQALLAAAEAKIAWVLKSGQWLHPAGPRLARALRKRR